MTTLRPRKPYTDEELEKLYPPGLQLQLVQILLRHGERTPVNARFQNAGLPAFWPYCSAVRHLRSAVLDDSGASSESGYTTMEWKRRLETFGPRDEPVIAAGPNQELDAICDFGSLTDVGRKSALELGKRLRHLYIDRLKYLPPTISSTEFLYLRSTPVPRALESLHQAYSGFYPPSAREGNLPPPTILTRAPADETLYPNDEICRRFAALSRAFAQRTADRWNPSEEMQYLNKLLAKWMPPDSPRVAVDSRPRLLGILDTVNSTLAHGPATRLPKEFYDEKGRRILEKIAVEEWYSGYQESEEYRTLGIGGLMGDIVARMVGSVERSMADGEYEVVQRPGQGHTRIKFGLSGCHDTTLAGVLASLGAYDMNKWPPFTSHIAIELFRKPTDTSTPETPTTQPAQPIVPPAKSGWLWWPFSTTSRAGSPAGTPPPGIGRKSTQDLTAAEKAKLSGYYVRLRYNDEPVTVPGCKTPGNHLDGDETFCTLVRPFSSRNRNPGGSR